MEERVINPVLSDAVKTLLLSLIAYSCAFTFEAGYCTWFRIPIDLIRLDTTRFLVCAFAFAVIALAFFPTFTLLYGAGQRIPLGSNPELNSFLFGAGLIIVAVFFLLLVSGFQPWPALALFLGYVAVTLPEVIVAFRLPGNAPFIERLTIVRRKTVADAGISISARIKRQPLIMLAIMIYLLIASWQLGRTHARFQKDFLCIGEMNPASVVLRIYGDRLICGELNNSKQIDNTFRIVDLSKEPNTILKLQTIGPLTVRR